ncbi:MAG: glutamate synthase large subunit [Candidatus Auribacterota bacterium]|jgi:glutamate synthase (NADPH/NADH) large chain/glutamate synthase (ferredoxin)|nr:glutamate synthase large subunit [Candidatus Auribacterota bacterium]
MDIRDKIGVHPSLYDPAFEHDSCGVGFVANIEGKASHDIVKKGLQILLNLVHRGAIGGDDITGDGAGILLQIPHDFFCKEFSSRMFSLPEKDAYGVGMIFLPQDKQKRREMEGVIAKSCEENGIQVLCWRDVPFCSNCLGDQALRAMPVIRQIFVNSPQLRGDDLERKLYVIRKVIERYAIKNNFGSNYFYICSFSCRTIVYKGMFTANQLVEFYDDLKDESLTSALALVHQRFSTNTFPSWPLAQPFRFLAHNGEINTLRGNINRMKARELQMHSPLFGNDINKLFPIIDETGSDSACIDNALELLVNGGRSLEHSMMMLVPEAFGTQYHMSQDKRAFYEYHTTIMEPWDGPAALVFSDGRKIGGVLDRNGLRPARYVVTKSGLVVLASEVGVIEFPAEEIMAKGRLTPGRIFLVDMEQKRIISDQEVKSRISRNKPYRKWLNDNRIELRGLFNPPKVAKPDQQSIIIRQTLFGYTQEELDMILIPMALNGQEPVGSMGNDAPLAVLSDKPQLLFSYFKQLFAQVTNPAIDPYREWLVMSLMSYVGSEGNLLEESPQHCRQLKLSHPILSNDDMQRIISASGKKGLKTAIIPMIFDPEGGVCALEKAIESISSMAEEKLDEGCSLLILSDKGADANYAPIPSLLATSALHHHLIDVGKRTRTGLIIETGEAREVMHFALLVGYGACAINPYLAFESLANISQDKGLTKQIDEESAIDNYIQSLKKGLLKIFSKMGISTLRSYRGALIFEAIGLNKDLIDRYFGKTPSRISGIGLDVIVQEIKMRHRKAFPLSGRQPKLLDIGGEYHYRHNQQKHLWTPLTISKLQLASRTNNYSVYKEYAKLINDQSKNLYTLRGLFRFKKTKPVPIEEVEPVDSIVKRFVTGAMSFGSISKEAHESLAIAMNRLGGKSNSGEGGEDEVRFVSLPNGDSLRSAIKQVASGRFGVTTNYLVNSSEMQIKIAQGAKPGEGGQLPGHKVDKTIGRVRHSTPGVTLISPPPHHDIYSIEDLAQLIFDLKNVQPESRVSVKLVAEVGVGTIAAGVAKAKADMILISGYDGGTGASPLSSIKHAGIPWELGLAETQQTLVLNELRDRVRLQVDGQLKTGRDVAIGALLGAEEFGFSTAPLVCLGCIMMRKCHLNTCPVGVATQDPDLRKKFSGSPDYVVNFMRFIAQELREIMAELGFRTIEEMVGRVDMLEITPAIEHWKARGLDFSKILSPVTLPEGGSLRCTRKQDHKLEECIDNELIKRVKPALDNKAPVKFSIPIKNCNRTCGAMLGGEIAKLYGSTGLPDDTIHIHFTGSAGQSFGAFAVNGMTFELEGDSNDYLGKGLSGGRIIVYPPKGSTFPSEKNIIIGNTVLYGATSGEVYIAGMAGERFAVRNSGAVAVVEGLGDHGCEYMTGGRVIVLGETGRNFAAGMSGGIAYVYDYNQLLDTLCNLDMVDIETVTEKEDIDFLRSYIEKHIKYTASRYAANLIENWEQILPYFVKIMPIDYRKALEKLKFETMKKDDTLTITEEVFN